MAKLIITGEIEAIDLKTLRGAQILELDETVARQGYCLLLVEVRDHVLQILRVLMQVSTRTLRPRKIPTA